MSEESKILDTRPKGDIVAISRPAWWTEIAVGKNGSVVQLLHPDHGWLTFLFPPEHANRLGWRSSSRRRCVSISRGRCRHRR